MPFAARPHSKPETEPDRAAGPVKVSKMTAHAFAETLRPAEALDALVARHGFWRIILTLPFVAIKRRRERITLAHHLPPHLMRDIGLDAGRGKSWELG